MDDRVAWHEKGQENLRQWHAMMMMMMMYMYKQDLALNNH